MIDMLDGIERGIFVSVCGSWFRMEYFDDLASGQCADQPPMSGLPAIAVKNLHLTGVKAYCDEFPAAHRKEPQSYMFSSESVSLLLTTHRNLSNCHLLEMFVMFYFMSPL